MRGEIWLHKVYEDERSGVVIVARDPAGPRRMADGQRASASDLKLPDVFRLVDEFDVVSDAGEAPRFGRPSGAGDGHEVTGD